MGEFTMDGRRLASEEAFWREFIEVLRPEGGEYFGRNLAAFNDALAGGPGWPGNDFALTITSSDTAIEYLGADFIQSLREICEESGTALLKLS
jgi:hypothetical protein